MINMKNLLFSTVVVFFIVIACGCTGKSSSAENHTVIEFGEISGRDAASAGFEVKETKLIPLETAPECMVGMVKRLRQYKDNYYLQSESRLLKFDKDGRFITEIGTRGNGPGEYLLINAFTIVRDSVYLFDGNQEKVHVYDIDGKWGRDIDGMSKLKFTGDVLPISENRVLIANDINFQKEQPLYMTWSFDNPGDIQEVVPCDFSYGGSYSFSSHPMTLYGNKIYLIKPLGSDIYSFNPDTSSVSPAVSINGILNDVSGGDYSEKLTGVLSAGGNPLMGVYGAGRFLVINLFNGTVILNAETGDSSYIGSNVEVPKDGIFPFMPQSLSYSTENKLVAVLPAQSYLSMIDSWGDDIKHLFQKQVDINGESNPVIIEYGI